LETSIRRLAAFALATLFLSPEAHALLFRAYVASDGNDANPCTLAAPCRLLPAALAAVASGGEIWMLESANYNTATVNINKSVTILAVPGAVGSIVATGGPAISITTPSIAVSLRNVVIVPLPGTGATDGVMINVASRLTIEDSLIANLPTANGINASGASQVTVIGTTIRDIVGGYALYARGGATAAISGSRLLSGTGGVIAHGDVASTTAQVTLTDSFVSQVGAGVFAYADNATAAAKISVTRSTIEGSTYGLYTGTGVAGAATSVTVSGSMVTRNNSGYNIFGTNAFIYTLLNNHIANNAGNTGSLTSIPLQ